MSAWKKFRSWTRLSDLKYIARFGEFWVVVSILGAALLAMAIVGYNLARERERYEYVG